MNPGGCEAVCGQHRTVGATLIDARKDPILEVLAGVEGLVIKEYADSSVDTLKVERRNKPLVFSTV
jgi:hypothetical protein